MARAARGAKLASVNFVPRELCRWSEKCSQPRERRLEKNYILCVVDCVNNLHTVENQLAFCAAQRRVHAEFSRYAQG